MSRENPYSEQWLAGVIEKRVQGNGLEGSRLEQTGRKEVLPQQVQDAPAPLFLSLTGPMVSGKNQVQLLWRNGKVQKYPNKTFTNWRQRALMELLGQDRPSKPIALPVSLVCEYWPKDLKTRDVTGMGDAIFHLLVKAGILKDDGLIYDFTWTRHELNRKFPKLLIEIRPY